MTYFIKNQSINVEFTTLIEYLFNQCFDIEDLADYLREDCTSDEEFDKIDDLSDDFLEELHCKLNDDLNHMCRKYQE
jgi:hypothetical protein